MPVSCADTGEPTKTRPATAMVDSDIETMLSIPFMSGLLGQQTGPTRSAIILSRNWRHEKKGAPLRSAFFLAKKRTRRLGRGSAAGDCGNPTPILRVAVFGGLRTNRPLFAV